MRTLSLSFAEYKLFVVFKVSSSRNAMRRSAWRESGHWNGDAEALCTFKELKDGTTCATIHLYHTDQDIDNSALHEIVHACHDVVDVVWPEIEDQSVISELLANGVAGLYDVWKVWKRGHFENDKVDLNTVCVLPNSETLAYWIEKSCG